MAKSNLTHTIRQILSEEFITINDTPVFVYQAQINSVCFASEPEELGDHPINHGWYKWSEVIPQLDDDTRLKVADALLAERKLRESIKFTRKESAKVERQELRAAEMSALKEMELFEEPAPAKKPAPKKAKKPQSKVAEPKEIMLPRGWRVQPKNLKAYSPKGGEWDIVGTFQNGWSLRNARGTSMSIDINGHVDTMQH